MTDLLLTSAETAALRPLAEAIIRATGGWDPEPDSPVGEDERVARIMVDELRRQAAKAEVHLAQVLAAKQRRDAAAVAAPVKPSRPLPPWPDRRAVRVWAIANGLMVARSGQIAAAVMAAYVAAHPEERPTR